MRRRGNENGFLVKRGVRSVKWVGNWHEYVTTPTGQKRLRKERVLGPCAEITETQAREMVKSLAIRSCRRQVVLDVISRPNFRSDLSPTIVCESGPCQSGVIGELLVAADLIRHGFSVYRAMDTTAPFDLIAYAGGEFMRVEVKVTKLKESGRPARSLRLRDGLHDILAIVAPDGSSIQYRGTIADFIDGRPSISSALLRAHKADTQHVDTKLS